MHARRSDHPARAELFVEHSGDPLIVADVAGFEDRAERSAG
jgi:hypothetical protein